MTLTLHAATDRTTILGASDSHGHGLASRLQMPSNAPVDAEPRGKAVRKDNQHVSRRSFMGVTVGLAAIAMPAAVAAAAANNVGPTNLPTRPTIDVAPELLALKKAFDVEFRKFEKTRKIYSAAESRYFAIRPAKPERVRDNRGLDATHASLMAIFRGEPDDHPDVAPAKEIVRINKEMAEAWEAADQAAQEEAAMVNADTVHHRQFIPTDRAASRIYRFKSRSLADIQVKIEVHRKWTFDIDYFMPMLVTDINRIAKAQRQSVSRGTTAVTS